MCPGTTGFRFTNAKESWVQRKHAACETVYCPNSIVVEERDEEWEVITGRRRSGRSGRSWITPTLKV